MNPYQVLIKPIMSEKSNDLRELAGKYAFQINVKATKADVKKAITSVYEVKVDNVRTVLLRGKVRRRGMHLSKPKLRKKAIVTLAEGQTIPLFEDQ